MNSIYLKSKPVVLNAADLIGEGGEAEVYKLNDKLVVKVFKQAVHPNFASSPQLKAMAADKQKERQLKLPAFPSGLPPQLVVPQDLIYDKLGGSAEIVAYSMNYLAGANQLLNFSRRDFQEVNGIDRKQLQEIFIGMHKTLSQLHSSGLVVGDLNGMNVLVKDKKAFFIDADSMQFGKYFCTTFCTRYVDPLICDLASGQMNMVRPHSIDSDWYAFSVMLFESLLCVHPYGGVYKPKDLSRRVPVAERPMRRISVLHPDVQYPIAALPLASIHDSLLGYFQEVFVADKRGAIPESILDLICAHQGLKATQTNPDNKYGVKLVSALSPTLITIGELSLTPVFKTLGRILQVAVQDGKLHFLYWENDKFMREKSQVIMNGSFRNDIQFKISREATFAAKDGNLFRLRTNASPERNSVELYRNEFAVFGANGSACFWLDGGKIWRQCGLESAKPIYEVLSQQTRIWIGSEWGFGFYQAAQFKRAFLFNCSSQSRFNIQDFVIPGNVLQAECYFSDGIAWFFTQRKEGADFLNSCCAIDLQGNVLARAEAPLSDDGWLGSIYGKCGAGDYLLSTVNGGLLQIGIEKGGFVELRKFEVSTIGPEHKLAHSPQGLYVWNSNEIFLLNTQSKAATQNPATRLTKDVSVPQKSGHSN